MKIILILCVSIFLSSKLTAQSNKALINEVNEIFQVSCSECTFHIDKNLTIEILCEGKDPFYFQICNIGSEMGKFGNSGVEIQFVGRIDGKRFISPMICLPVNSEDDLLEYNELSHYHRASEILKTLKTNNCE